MSKNEFIIDCETSPYHKMNLHSAKFARKVIREVVLANGMKLSDGKTDLINSISPKFEESKANSKVGSIVDWANSDVSGNIIFFLLNHVASKVYSDPQALADLMDLPAEYIEELADKKMGMESKYSKSSIISEVIPKWYYEVLKKNVPADTTYFSSRGIDQVVVEEEGVLSLEGLSAQDIEEILKDREGIAQLFLWKFEYIEKVYDKMKIDDKKAYLKTKTKILEDFITNLELNANIKKRIKNSLSNLYKKQDAMDKKQIHGFQTEAALEKHLSEIEKKDNWFDEYQPQTAQTLSEFSKLQAYRNSSGYIETITCRTPVQRADGSRYVQIGKTVVEEDYKKDAEFMFICEGKADKMALKTMLKQMGIENKSSIVTFMNANSNLPYGVIRNLRENANLKIVNMLDNDNAGKKATSKIFSKLFEEGFIENVHDFSAFIEEENIPTKDINDFIQEKTLGVDKFNQFISSLDKYQRKIINPGVESRKDVYYLKNTTELKKLLENENFFKKPIEHKVYIKIKNDVYDLSSSLVQMRDFYKDKKEVIDFKVHMIEYIKNMNIDKANVVFLEKGKNYHHELVKNQDAQVFLVENPGGFYTFKSIYSLPTVTKTKNNGDVVNDFIERFIYDESQTAEQMACNEKLSPREFVQDNFKEAENFENFSNWWISRNEKGIEQRDWTSKELKEKCIVSYKHELNLLKAVYDKYESTEDKKEYLTYFLKLDKIIKTTQNQNIHNGVRGSAMNFVSLTNLGWTTIPQNIFEYVIENKEVMFSERFMNPTKKEMADVDVEYGKNGEIIEEGLHSEGLFVPLVVKKLGVGNVNLGKGQINNKTLELSAGLSWSVKPKEITILKNSKDEMYFEKDGVIWFMDDNDKIVNLGNGSLADTSVVLTEKTIENLQKAQIKVVENQEGVMYFVDKFSDVRKIDIEYEYQANLHPCGYTMVPNEIREYFTKATTSIKFTTKELEAMGANLKYDYLYQRIERPGNIENLETIYMSDVLFKGLPQIADGAQQVLLTKKGLQFPEVKTKHVKYKEEGSAEGEYSFKNFYEDEFGYWIEEGTGKKSTEKEIREEYNSNGRKLEYLTTYAKTESTYEVLKSQYNTIDLEFMKKYLPKIYANIEKIMNQEVNLEEMMIAAATFRPSFSANIYMINGKIYNKEEDSKGTVSLVDVETGRPLSPRVMDEQLKTELGIEFENTGKVIEVKNKKDKNNNLFKNLTFIGYTDAEIEYIKKSSPIFSGIKKAGKKKGVYKLTVQNKNVKKFDVLIEGSTMMKNDLVEVVDYEKEMIYEKLFKEQSSRENFRFLDISGGYILFQEQMYSFITTISQKFAQEIDLGSRHDEFIENWKGYGELIRKYSSKAGDKVTQELIKEADEVFEKIKKTLAGIEKKDPKFAAEALAVINNQFFILKSGAYLYNMGHAVYVAMNAMQEAVFRRNPELFNAKEVVKEVKEVEESTSKNQIPEEIEIEIIEKATSKIEVYNTVSIENVKDKKTYSYRLVYPNDNLYKRNNDGIDETIRLADNRVNESSEVLIIEYNGKRIIKDKPVSILKKLEASTKIEIEQSQLKIENQADAKQKAPAKKEVVKKTYNSKAKEESKPKQEAPSAKLAEVMTKPGRFKGTYKVVDIKEIKKRGTNEVIGYNAEIEDYTTKKWAYKPSITVWIDTMQDTIGANTLQKGQSITISALSQKDEKTGYVKINKLFKQKPHPANTQAVEPK